MNRLLNLTVSSEFLLNIMKRAMSYKSHASPLVIHTYPWKALASG